MRQRFNGKIQTYKYVPKNESLVDLVKKLYPKLIYIANKHPSYKLSMDLKATFQSPKFPYSTFHIQSKRYSKFEANRINKILKDLQSRIENMYTEGSGWKIASIDEVSLNISEFTPLKGSSYSELPDYIKDKKAILNIYNEDDRCFLYSILAFLYPKPTDFNKANYESYIKFVNKLNTTMLQFPQKLDSNIEKFEKANNIIINVYSVENKIVVPVRVSSNIDSIYTPFLNSTKEIPITDENIQEYTKDLLDLNDNKRLVNLFLYENHYSLINNLHRLVSKQVSSNHEHNLICYRCLLSFKSPLKYYHHLRFCVSNRATKAVTLLPKPKTCVSFKRYESQQKLPHVVYFDFECLFNSSMHVPIAVSYNIVSNSHSTSTLKTIVADSPSDNVSVKFVRSLIDDLITSKDSVYNKYFKRNQRSQIPTPSAEQRNQINCHICETPFQPDHIKVVDHDHFTGLFRGMAHQSCNINCKEPTFIPIIAHNSSKYDTHLFIKELSEINDPNLTVTYLPSNTETLISFSVKYKVGEYTSKGKTCSKYFELRFLDSLRFMASSLDNLTKNLTAHPHLTKVFTDNELLRQKGIFPYEYLTSFDVLSESKLPPIESFYSSLRLESVSEDEFKHANNCFNHYKCKTIKDYLLLYLKTDVLHLSDIFEEFRDTCLKHYRLDPLWFYTSPSLAWNAMLKQTKVSLELISDHSILEFFESQLRGGVSSVFHRYAEANNKYLDDYDSKKPSSYLTYLDANNLYGYAMSKPLPTGNFRFLEAPQIAEIFNAICNNTYIPSESTGKVLEVDISYPQLIHNAHNDYPFLPERLNDKLIPNLRDKCYYILNEHNLLQAIKHGLKLVRIHRIITFDQSPWLKTYIDFNTNLRAQSKNAFEKDFFKLMNNSVFGKTMENIRKRCNIEILNDNDDVPTLVKLNTFISKPNYKEPIVIPQSKINIFQFTKTKITYDKPIYLGAQILDLSKTLMYQFHYEYMKPKFSDLKTLYTDTDSIIYHIGTEDFYKDISDDVNEWFDTSGYTLSKGSIPLNVNKKIIGKFKDEMGDEVMSHFCANRPKSYSYKINGSEASHNTLKGVMKAVRNKMITFEDYKECVFEDSKKDVDQTTFEVKNHVIKTITRSKLALESSDDKRILLGDKVSTLAIGHYKTLE